MYSTLGTREMCIMESRVEYLSKQKCLLRPRRKAGAGGNDPVAPRGNRGLAPVQLAWRKFSYVTAPSQRPFPDVHQLYQALPPLRSPLHSLAAATMSCLRMRRAQFASQVSCSQFLCALPPIQASPKPASSAQRRVPQFLVPRHMFASRGFV